MIYEQKQRGCGSNTFLDLDLLVNRGIGWVGWKYQSGWVEWEFDWNAFASWYEAENFKEPDWAQYNGSGQLIYRGAVMNYDEPIASIRLKASGADCRITNTSGCSCRRAAAAARTSW